MTNAPEPREIPAGKVLLAEYAEVNESNSARTEVMASGKHARLGMEVKLIYSTPGFEPAGSCARWTNGYWAVRFQLEGATHGQRYKPADEAEAREHFARMTAPVDPTEPNRHEQRQEGRRQRLLDRAERRTAESNRRYRQFKSMSDCIPFGQPILVGHHSEKRDRAFRKRMCANMDKACELHKEAGELRGRAEAVGTGGISSDDPEAVTKLREQLAAAEAEQAKMVKANACLRRKDDAGLQAMGYTAAEIAALKQPDMCGRVGYADYMTKNNGANIRRLKERIATLALNQSRPTVEIEYTGGVTYREDSEENRVMIVFPGKPDAGTRQQLKGAGLRWSPTNGAWQRLLNNAGRYAAKGALQRIGLVPVA
jgi:hypothetical protein